MSGKEKSYSEKGYVPTQIPQKPETETGYVPPNIPGPTESPTNTGGGGESTPNKEE